MVFTQRYSTDLRRCETKRSSISHATDLRQTRRICIAHMQKIHEDSQCNHTHPNRSSLPVIYGMIRPNTRTFGYLIHFFDRKPRIITICTCLGSTLFLTLNKDDRILPNQKDLFYCRRTDRRWPGRLINGLLWAGSCTRASIFFVRMFGTNDSTGLEGENVTLCELRAATLHMCW